ncbi:hypothetical protein EDC01DRAFT_751255 [Geopyxis carbonaria]|nr:hypothetical protein EDC01DRAFT_751255 [Geopyxis carbonaria]
MSRAPELQSYLLPAASASGLSRALYVHKLPRGGREAVDTGTGLSTVHCPLSTVHCPLSSGRPAAPCVLNTNTVGMGSRERSKGRDGAGAGWSEAGSGVEWRGGEWASPRLAVESYMSMSMSSWTGLGWAGWDGCSSPTLTLSSTPWTPLFLTGGMPETVPEWVPAGERQEWAGAVWRMVGMRDGE